MSVSGFFRFEVKRSDVFKAFAVTQVSPAQLARFIQSQFNLGQSRFKQFEATRRQGRLNASSSWIGHQRIFGTCHWWHWVISLENWHISWSIRLQKQWLKVSCLFDILIHLSVTMTMIENNQKWQIFHSLICNIIKYWFNLVIFNSNPLNQSIT